MSISLAIDFKDGRSEIWPVSGQYSAGEAWVALAKELGLTIYSGHTPFFINGSNAEAFADELNTIKRHLSALPEFTERRLDDIVTRLRELKDRDDWDAQYG
jgi:hypothetical protein